MENWTTRLLKGGALLDDLRQLVCNWRPDLNTASAIELVENTLNKSTKTRSRDIYKQVFLPRLVQGNPKNAWRYTQLLEIAEPGKAVVQPFYYWLTCRSEEILYDFVTQYLFRNRSSKQVPVSIEETVLWISTNLSAMEKTWSASVQLKTARGILAALRDFGILQGGTKKQLAFYHLPVETFAIIAFLLCKELQDSRAVLTHPDWRLFFLDSSLVEQMLFDAHQHKWLSFEIAGAVARIEFPVSDFEDYVHVVFRRNS